MLTFRDRPITGPRYLRREPVTLIDCASVMQFDSR